MVPTFVPAVLLAVPLTVVYIFPCFSCCCAILLVTFGVLFFYRRLPKGYILSGSGKAVLITGCDTGFGNLLSKRLDEKGFKVFSACMFPNSNGARELKAKHPQIETFKLDVTDENDVASSVNYVRNKLGGKELWALVNNAGVAQCAEIEWSPMSLYEQCMAVNALGVVRMTKAFLPMLRKSHGRVVNVASLAGRFGIPGFSAYCQSKSACIAFSDCLRREISIFGVHVATVEPGFYRTPLVLVDRQTDKNKEFWEQTPNEVRTDYGIRYFESYLDMVRSMLDRQCSDNVSEVIECMEEAICRSNPRFRYVPNWKSELKFTIISFLPDFVVDYLSMRPKECPAVVNDTRVE